MFHHKQLSNDVPVSTSCTITLAAEAPAAFAENLERLLAILDPENGFTQGTAPETEPCTESSASASHHITRQGLASAKEGELVLKASEQEQGAMAVWSDLQVLTRLSQLNIT